MGESKDKKDEFKINKDFALLFESKFDNVDEWDNAIKEVGCKNEMSQVLKLNNKNLKKFVDKLNDIKYEPSNYENKSYEANLKEFIFYLESNALLKDDVTQIAFGRFAAKLFGKKSSISSRYNSYDFNYSF